MKKTLFIFNILLCSFITAYCQGNNLWAFLSYASFNSPEGPYLETYLTVAGKSVQFVKIANGKYQATVNILMTFKKGGEIKAFKKYDLFSPEVEDTLHRDFNFVDQQRFLLQNGTYDFEIQLSDKSKTIPAIPYSQSITLDFPDGKPTFSSIQLIKSYSKAEVPGNLTKSGFDLVPYTFTFYPKDENKLIFYVELYNMEKLLGKDQKFILSYFIESQEANLKLNNYVKVKKEITKEVNPILTEISLENLASGNYNLVIEARNQQNELVTSTKLFFQRMNPKATMPLNEIQMTEIENTFAEKITQIDSLKEYISCTYPIATGIEKSFIRNSVKTVDMKTLQQFFYGFWTQRDATNPEQAWLTYKAAVYKVQVNFGTQVKKGYQTDRGRVYLEYGPPNTRSTQYYDPSNYPYEIWQYYTLNNSQRNKKFVFYLPDRATNDFFLLHSDAIGEINNQRWKIYLRNRIYTSSDIQDTQVIKSWGDFEEDYWALPN
ncbi:MAG: GWxTD domain-containing protein [Bacteroidales bacterium]|nr:GWxTD domain-containing protein [Bacteroidales bacterium]